MSAKAIYDFGTYGSREPPKRTHWQVTEEEWREAVKDKTRSKAIVTDVLLEGFLDLVIAVRLSPKDEVCDMLLDEEHGVGFNHKARLAYVLGLIKKGTMQDLFSIHNIRNRFAHVTKSGFSDEKLVEHIRKLSTVGSKKRQVTEDNYMDFYDKAAEKCVVAMGSKLMELKEEIGNH